MARGRKGIGASGYLKRLFVGRALASHKAEHQLLPKFLALPVFSSDPLSSVAYATEEMMLVLVLAGAGALNKKIPLAIAIAALLIIVVTSYRQTVRAYPRGGGSYIVARENLGTVPGLIAAAAILTDYVLTVAVSVTAGTVAIISAVPSMDAHRVPLAIALVLLVTLANLRGVKEAGTLFAIPTYGFVAIVGVTLVVGLARCVGGCPQAPTAHLPIVPVVGLSLFLMLRAFASGATALTGVEAIADGVQAFRRPQAKNAADTLLIMAVLAVTMFLGITILAQLFHVRIDEEIAASHSVLSQIGETVYGRGLGFILLQTFTAGILILAANTAFQDFPRLSSILARDRFMPSQFRNRGDRLVFSNGVLVLAGLACLLIWVFDAQLTRLIQLYVVGVFTAFTLSQTGMVRRWFRIRGQRWRQRAVINGVGAVTTGVVLVIVTITKFHKGAWIVILAIPIIVTFFLGVHRHYARVGARLRSGTLFGTGTARATFFLLVPDLGPATLEAIGYLRAIRPERLEPLYIGPASLYARVAELWAGVAPRLGALRELEWADRHLVRAVRAMVRARHRERGEYLAIIIPEVLRGRSWWQFVGERRTLLLKGSLLFEPGVVVTDIPFLPDQEHVANPARPVEPERSVVLVPISAVHDAVVRAVTYAKTLQPAVIEGIFFVTDPEDVQPVIEAWHERRMDIPLLIEEAPFRDVDAPLLAEVRHHTARGDTVVTVVLPELVPIHWWENVLHNQTAFSIKRLLLFEPMVVVTSVPFHLREPESGPPGAGPKT
ncbi:MAG: APC family permease [Actinomycetota bacterium]